MLAALDERVDERERGERREPDADGVQSCAGRAGGPRHHAQSADEPDDAERHVHQEDRAPAESEQVAVGERATQDRRGDRRQAHDRPEQRERFRELGLVEDLLEHAEALRDQERSERALCDARGDQDAAGRRRRTQRGGGREADDAHDEETAAAESIAEAGTGDQEHRERECVGRAQPLECRRAAAQVGADRRSGDVHDRPVDQVHDLGD